MLPRIRGHLREEPSEAYIKGAGHSGSDLATQNMVFAAFRPGAASLNPEAAKLPKACAFNSL